MRRFSSISSSSDSFVTSGSIGSTAYHLIAGTEFRRPSKTIKVYPSADDRSCRQWRLEPHDELVRSETRRASDGKQLERLAPPETTYWAMARPDSNTSSMCGVSRPGRLRWRTDRNFAASIRPRTGAFTDLPAPAARPYRCRPPDRHRLGGRRNQVRIVAGTRHTEREPNTIQRQSPRRLQT